MQQNTANLRIQNLQQWQNTDFAPNAQRSPAYDEVSTPEDPVCVQVDQRRVDAAQHEETSCIRFYQVCAE